MSVPTVNVTVQVNDSAGDPVSDAHVVAKLKTAEKYNGFVIPTYVEGETDATGSVVLAMFPNELGTEGSEYRVKIISPITGKSLISYVTIPNADCNLADVADLPPYDKRSISVVMQADIDQNSTDISTNADGIAANAAAITAGADAQTAHEADVANPHGVTKTQVGLGNVLDVEQVPASEKGVANGVAGLDAGGKVPVSQLPETVVGAMEYKGTFVPASGYPASPDKGDYYAASADGSVNTTDYAVGDWAVFNGATWDKLDRTVQLATTEIPGEVELATAAEAIAHTLSDKAVTPAGLLDIYTKLQGILTDKWLFDSLRFLNESGADLISGAMVGSEGPWNTTFIGSLPFVSAYNTTRTIGPTRVWVLSDGGSVDAWPSDAYDRETLAVDKKMFAITSNGVFPLAVVVASGGSVYVELTPKVGQIIPDPTGDVMVVVGEEDTANKTPGPITRPETFIGNDVDTPAEMYAALNARRDDSAKLNATQNKIAEPFDFTTTWAAQNCTITTTSEVAAPNNSKPVSIGTAVTADPQARYTLTGLASDIYTASIWLRGKGSSIGKQASIAIYDGGYKFSDPVTLSAEWQRISATMLTAGIPTLVRVDFIDSASTGEEAYLWGAELVQGSTPTTITIDNSTPLTDVAPDPYLLEDGAIAGRVLSGEATVLNGVATADYDATGALSYIMYEALPTSVSIMAVVNVTALTGTPYIREWNGIDAKHTPLTLGKNTIIIPAGVDGGYVYVGADAVGEKVSYDRIHIYEIADIPGVLDIGYKSDQGWQSQLGDGVRKTFKLDRPAKAAPSGVYRFNGTTYVEETGWTFDATANSITLTTALGVSETLKIVYTHEALVPRPAPTLEAVARTGVVHYTQSAGNADFVSWLTGNVPTGATVAIDSSVVKSYREGSVGQLVDTVKHDAIDPTASGHGVIWTDELVESGGEYYVQIHYVEVVDLAQHSGGIPVVDYVVTTADNDTPPNILENGTKHVPTGVAVPGA
ncbi:hypothetical protein SYK_02900 [Pseudodesulfovibrio nedwellii]|uniref:Uncharacterized protein n=1 Tax=Pseudodesulfovibrio nedwellii TaxID=2973072 RepID=A0ABM8AWL9_9BACT|nr:hypothetical protein [Pseudodesulfovibrio nedwellii]BDQ35930.1 hypothetical protein SYK_02900 [Pseudodesulfovibrio nedwellii]